MTPRLVRSVAEFRAACSDLRSGGARLGLVPTMGALHHGHQSLMRLAAAEAEHVVVTIFVNPTQFGPGEDYERYPRTLDSDLEICAAADVAVVFAPERAEIYPPGECTRVTLRGLTDTLCGPARPGHFDGVATVVTKLLCATGPCAAVFGRKDYQQLQVIKRLVTDLLLPVHVVEHPTVRDADGLATSSRNRYLSAAERALALAVPRALHGVGASFARGERDIAALQAQLASALDRPGLALDYAAIADSRDLSLLSSGTVEPGAAGAFIAVRIGKTRLIDNLIFGADPLPEVSDPS